MLQWAGLWFHADGLVHVIGRHADYNMSGAPCRTGYADCGEPLASIPRYAHKKWNVFFIESNTKFPFPTCLACWDASNFGSYAPR